MSPRLDAFLERNSWNIAVFIVTLAVFATILNGQVASKAEKADVDRLEVKVEAIKRMLCRDPRNAVDSACP